MSTTPPLFGVAFVGSSFPLTEHHFARVDPTHWLLDVASTITPQYLALKEVSVFLTMPGLLDDAAALSLYISLGGAAWQYRGFVSNSHPSEVLPLQWPEPDPSLLIGPGVVQLGISVEPLAEAVQKEGSKLAGREEFAKRVAMDLFRYMESFNQGMAGDKLIVPANVLDRWFEKFSNRFRRDPDFLMRSGVS